jgi:flavin-binding protein dodecin
MDSQHASSGEHPKIIGTSSETTEQKLQTVLEAVGKTVAAIEYGEVESRQGSHAAEAVVFHFTDGTALSIEIGSNARDLSASRDLTPPDVHTDLRPFWTHRARPHD